MHRRVLLGNQPSQRYRLGIKTRKKLDFDYGKNTTAKGNALEKKDRFNRSFFLARIFSYYKGNRTLEII